MEMQMPKQRHIVPGNNGNNQDFRKYPKPAQTPISFQNFPYLLAERANNLLKIRTC